MLLPTTIIRHSLGAVLRRRFCVRLHHLLMILLALSLFTNPTQAQNETTSTDTPPSSSSETNDLASNVRIIDTLITGAEFANPSNRAIRQAFQWAAVVYEDNTYQILHRSNNTPADAFYHLHSSQGRPTHLAAVGPTLYLLFKSGSILSLTYNLDHNKNTATLLPLLADRVLPPLPTNGRILGWAAVQAGPIALIANDAFTASNEAAPLEAFRLIRNRWQPTPLPPSLQANHIRALAPLNPRLNQFGIFTDRPGTSSTHLFLFDNDQWTQQTLNLPPATYTQVTSIQSIPYILQQEPQSPTQLRAYRLRNQTALPIGTFNNTSNSSQFWIAPNAHSLSAFLIHNQKEMTWATLNLTTPLTSTPATSQDLTFKTITQQPLPLPEVDPVTVLVLIAVTIGMAFLFMTTRSDPAQNTPTLPEHMTLAEHQRVLAGALDVGIAVAATVWWLDLIGPMEIFRYWPLLEPEFDRLLPASMVIGLFVAHTTLTEIFTAKTLGKLIFKCQVTNITGQPPHIWQVFIRNLFKGLELAVPYLLILPLVSPFRQRLGDLVAKTVVINKPNPTHSANQTSKPQDSDSNPSS